MEQALIAETGRLLPITARNVMEHLDLHPGELVAIALRLAQVLYALQPNLDHASLLEALTVNWNQILTEVKPHLFSMRGC